MGSFAYLFSVSGVICLSLDLILTLKYPFSPKEKRIRLYYVVSILYALVLTFCVAYDESSVPTAYIFVIMTLVLYIVNLVSLGYACMRLCRRSVNRNMRVTIVVRHMLFIVVYALSNFVGIIPQAQFIFPNWYVHPWVFNWFYVLFGQGILFFIIRMFEPYAWNLVRRRLGKFLYCGKETTCRDVNAD